MRQIFVAGLAVLAIVGCSKPAGDAAATPGDAAPSAAPVVAANVPKDMLDGPAPGKWKMTMAMEGGAMEDGMDIPPQEFCYKERISFEDSQKMQQQAGMTCSEQSYKREGATLIGHSVCTMEGGPTITSDVRVTGDFDTAYEMEIASKMDPAPMPNLAETKMKAKMERLGDC